MNLVLATSDYIKVIEFRARQGGQKSHSALFSAMISRLLLDPKKDEVVIPFIENKMKSFETLPEVQKRIEAAILSEPNPAIYDPWLQLIGKMSNPAILLPAFKKSLSKIEAAETFEEFNRALAYAAKIVHLVGEKFKSVFLQELMRVGREIGVTEQEWKLVTQAAYNYGGAQIDEPRTHLLFAKLRISQWGFSQFLMFMTKYFEVRRNAMSSWDELGQHWEVDVLKFFADHREKILSWNLSSESLIELKMKLGVDVSELLTNSRYHSNRNDRNDYERHKNCWALLTGVNL